MIGMRKSAAHGVRDLLDAQHKALLRGDVKGLGQMAPELERAFARLGRERGPRDDVLRIKAAAARNARLLMAAQAGVSSARARLTSARSTELTTYAANGKCQTGAAATGRILARR